MDNLSMPTGESNHVEFKRELNDASEKFEKAVVSFLNSQEGGLVYVGIDDDGSVYGVDDADAIQRAAIDKIKNNILPTALGLFDVVAETIEGKSVLKLIVSSGSEKPYYIQKYGMSPKGCFIRVGASAQPMTTQMIDTMYARRNRVTLSNMKSPRQKLTFRQLKNYYEAEGLSLGDQFERSLDLMGDDGVYNYAAFLLADENNVSIKVAKYAGTDKVDLIENEEYGYCCLLTALDRVLEKMTVENKTFAKITSTKRLERKMVNATALREAVINAYAHNDWSHEVPPVVEMYSDRLTITSYGGLISSLSEEDFFNCVSVSRNRELMRIFKDVGLVEQLGSGMGRILKAYDKSVFKITPNFMIVTFPYAEGFDMQGVANNVAKNVADNVAKKELDALILEMITSNSQVTADEIAKASSNTRRTIQRHIKAMATNGIIKRVGAANGGHWEIVSEQAGSV